MARGNPALERIVPDSLTHLAGFPIRRMPLAALLERMWELRANITAYDAAYIAPAERLDSPLITCDAKLIKSSRTRCRFDLIV